MARVQYEVEDLETIALLTCSLIDTAPNESAIACKSAILRTQDTGAMNMIYDIDIKDCRKCKTPRDKLDAPILYIRCDLTEKELKDFISIIEEVDDVMYNAKDSSGKLIASSSWIKE